MKHVATLGLALCSLLATESSASAQWYQSRHASDYRQYDSGPGSSAPSYYGPYRSDYGGGMAPNDTSSRGYVTPGSAWPYGGNYSSSPNYYRNAPVDYVSAGKQAFRAGQYQLALRHWQHALVDSPNNGGVELLLAQALFALGKYDDAAKAIQAAMQMLPENEWDKVVTNYVRVYANIQNYKDQLKALENARNAKPDEPAMRFVLGYHFGYLGYPKHAVVELDKALDLQPQDQGSQQLRDIFALRSGLPARRRPP